MSNEGGQRSGIRGQETESQVRDITVVLVSEAVAMAVQSAKHLIVYKKAYQTAMKIFVVSRRFPTDERYALTSQVRRSSRSVCLNLREAWAKRRYAAHFLSKLTDCDAENGETD